MELTGYSCAEYSKLDLIYCEAWATGNHDKVMEYMAKIREHKHICPICNSPAGLADQLWPGVQVAQG